MSLFPLLAQAAPAVPDISTLVEEAQRAQELALSPDLLKWIAVVALISIVAWWVASNLVTRESASFLNAIKLLAVYAAGGILLSILMVFIYIAAAASSAGILAVGVVAMLLILSLSLGAPMLVYSIGLLRSVLFVLISMVLSAAGQLAVSVVVPPPRGFAEMNAVQRKFAALPPEERQKFVEALSQSAAKGAAPASPEAMATDRSKTIEERHAALQKMYAVLDKQRLELKWGDQAALDSYNRQNARYQELLKQLQAEAAQPR